MNPTTANYDEPWKEALTEYFEAFLCFFFPEVHQLIDWTKIPESLEKELKRITASAKTKNVSLTNSIQLSVISYQLSVTNWKQAAIPLL
ncbi:hypothetical protein BH695_3312 [Microcystis aeruginosa PCC 7806SL]|uniref:Transposase n=2 Tax=Microcystis aeruginosa (strain PCC 7806) TaxID=267872 RepID=A0AB33C3X5_MICA7|nr:hypothetical protein BH695_3312 [Microcystis aeruginosa PCC 7806SL]CAO89951.1 unnamed protein product [Microcystis aeruginosa PCC 7806]